MKYPALAGLALLLGACAGGPSTVITNQDLDEQSYFSNGYNATVRDGGAPASVAGTPFAGADAAALLAPLRPPAVVAASHFVPTGDSGTRMVIIFAPKAPLDRSQLCESAEVLQPKTLAPGAGGDFRAIASLCRGGRPISTAQIAAPMPTSPQDPAYADIMGQLFITVMPLSVPRDIPVLP